MPNFVVSMGWFYKFKMRYGFHSIKRAGEAKSANKDAAALYPERLKVIIEELGGGCSTSPCRFSTCMKQGQKEKGQDPLLRR